LILSCPSFVFEGKTTERERERDGSNRQSGRMGDRERQRREGDLTRVAIGHACMMSHDYSREGHAEIINAAMAHCPCCEISAAQVMPKEMRQLIIPPLRFALLLPCLPFLFRLRLS
jgi:hypothetical protein